jgi:hypothetical protein
MAKDNKIKDLAAYARDKSNKCHSRIGIQIQVLAILTLK